MTPTVTELTGRRDRAPLSLPTALRDDLALLGDTLGIDAFGEVTRRAASAGLHRQGAVSCGGATRLLPGLDGWLALSLARPADVASLPALLGHAVERTREGDPADASVWDLVTRAVAGRPVGELVDLGILLGLPIARVGEVTWAGGPVIGRHRISDRGEPLGDPAGLQVVDCSSLWAGPLCARTLERQGATVTKLESIQRPDGARQGSTEFYASLHSGQAERTVDLADPDGRAEFIRLISTADVVIEGSRPRAFQQLGVDALAILAVGRPRIWVSITAHGRVAGPDRVGFGDDAAAAGGLVVWDDEGPCFVGDAIADPLTGLSAAAAVRSCLARGGTWLIDAALARTAAFSARAPGS